jgi:hypothetical protein
MRGKIAVLGFCLSALLSTNAWAGACGPGDPAGRYEGQAKSADGTALALTLNLRCDKGAYAARFSTSAGDFMGKDVSFAQGRLTVTFDTGVNLGLASLIRDGTGLTGAFEMGSDKGTMTLKRAGDAVAQDASAPRLDLTPAEWREDLATLARELPKRHANAFVFLPKAEFEARVADLDRRIPQMSPDQIFVALSQLVNAIGDGHTGIVSPPSRENMPIELSEFGGDIRVTAAGAGLEKAIGAKVLKIGDTAIGQARTLALTLTPKQELPELREGRIVVYLARGLTLHGLGIIPDRTRAVYTLQDDAGQVFQLEVHGLGVAAGAPMTSVYPKDALRSQNPDDPFWCKPLPQARAIYCAWHGYQNLHAKTQAMWKLIDQSKPQKLIIDMRDNGGGDNTVGFAELVKPLKARADLNKKGRLYVLVGPPTFSAAMNNAAQFQDQTEATLVGQTIGERPNSYQEPRQFNLPNSHLIVRVSTRYYAFRKTGENAVRPNREIAPNWADAKAGRDDDLDWVLAQPAG